MQRKRRLYTFLRVTVWVVVIALSAAIALPMGIRHDMSPYIVREPAQLPANPVAVIFGAGVRRSGALSPILEERVRGGVELYFQGKVDSLLMTGDGRTATNNEVEAMQRYAEGLGVPASAILIDGQGLSTYDSCLRLQREFAISSATLVTQQFHMYRAEYLCRAVGVEASGYAVGSWKGRILLRTPYLVREWLATYKAAWQVSRP